MIEGNAPGFFPGGSRFSLKKPGASTMIPTQVGLDRVIERALRACSSLLAFLFPPARLPVPIRIAPTVG